MATMLQVVKCSRDHVNYGLASNRALKEHHTQLVQPPPAQSACPQVLLTSHRTVCQPSSAGMHPAPLLEVCKYTVHAVPAVLRHVSMAGMLRQLLQHVRPLPPLHSHAIAHACFPNARTLIWGVCCAQGGADISQRKWRACCHTWFFPARVSHSC